MNNIIFGLPGPHDVPFAAPLWGGILVGVIFGAIVFRVMDYFIDTDKNSK